MAPVLPDGWEAVAAEDGRTYYWNVNTNETVWEAPTTAHSPIAASFLNMAAASSESGRQAAAGILNTSSGSSEGGSTPTSESGRSKALGVDAMRKYRIQRYDTRRTFSNDVTVRGFALSLSSTADTPPKSAGLTSTGGLVSIAT